MRIQLAAAVAIAPLMMASGAAAQVVISTERTTPITTSTANNGSPGSVRIANGGIIRLTTGSAATVDSSHNLTLDLGGQIIMDGAADGATGILVLGGNTANIVNDGVITITDSYTPTDTDNDGDVDGRFAEGTGRYAIRLTGPGVLTGDITSTGGASVSGNQSAAFSLETGLDGDLLVAGAVSISGDESYGVRSTGDISGNVYVGGTLNATGEETVGVSVEGDVGGRVVIGGNVTTTGFRYVGPILPVNEDRLDADDLLIGGPAVSISSNVAGGVLLDLAHVDIAGDTDDDDDGILDDTDTDDNNDGIPDTLDGDARVVSIGSAPALQVGSMTDAITLGEVGVGNDAFGLVNRGIILSAGQYENIAATALRIGLDGGMGVTLEGGLRNTGTIEATTRNADSRAVLMAAGAQAALISNGGTIQAVGEGDDAMDVVGVDVLAGATTPALINSGTIAAEVRGEAGNAFAIRDTSGTLTSVTNNGLIFATISPTDDDDDTDDDNTNFADEVITGRRVAIDLSANTTGVVVVQDGVIDGDDGGDGLADPDADGDGVDDVDEPSIIGDIVLGAGADQLQILNGTVTGSIEFGAGSDSLLIDGGAIVRGGVSDADGQLNINVADGVLDARQTTAATISDLSVGADGVLIVSLDGSTGSAGGFNVTGAATIANGAGLGAHFTTLLDDPTRFVVVQATTLTAGDLDQTRLQQNSPFMYVVTGGVDSTLNQIYIDARHRTAEEFGFISSEADAYSAFYEALATDSELLEAFLNQTGRAGFFEMYEQILPENSGGSLMSLATGVDAVTRALSGRGHAARSGETSAWLQEINFYADKDRTESYGFRSEGFGFAGGVERGTSLGALGLSFALTSSDMEDPESEAEEVLSAQLLELGLYWRAQGVHWNTWARAAVGYASFDSIRQLVAPGINRRNESSWNGYSVALAAGAAYNYQTGRWSIRPEAFVEYFRLSEDGHEETGSGGAFDLAYADRDGHILSSTVAVSLGASFGENHWLRPELRVGWRQILSHDPGDTVASFLSTGTPFTLSGESMEGGGPIVGLRVNLGNELGFLSIEADAEMLQDYVRYALLLRASFLF